MWIASWLEFYDCWKHVFTKIEICMALSDYYKCVAKSSKWMYSSAISVHPVAKATCSEGKAYNAN